jgi:hypothetical protein
MPGTIFIDKDRTAFVTALSSYDLNFRKRDIDITHRGARSSRNQTNSFPNPDSLRVGFRRPFTAAATMSLIVSTEAAHYFRPSRCSAETMLWQPISPPITSLAAMKGQL